jgi:hypothetical protein
MYLIFNDIICRPKYACLYFSFFLFSSPLPHLLLSDFLFLKASRLTPARAFPLGLDRHGTFYYSYLSDPIKSRVWVQQAPSDKVLQKRKTTGEQVGVGGEGGGGDGINQQPQQSQFKHMFGSEDMCWISSLESIQALAQSLDRRGVNEKDLQESLFAHLEVLRHE